MDILVLFSHGKESGPWGSKIKHLADVASAAGCRVASVDYRGISSPDDRAAMLSAYDTGAPDGLILVGSSMGGYVSAIASQAMIPSGLFLMAPAFGLPGYANQHPRSYATHTLVTIGWQDEAVPVDRALLFAQEARADLHVFDCDHRMMSVLPRLGELLGGFIRKVGGQ